MVFVIPVNAGAFATGYETGRKSKWDDAERDTLLRQQHVRENIAVGTQDSNIFAANAQNTYRGNQANRDDQFGAVTQNDRLRAGLAEYQFKADDTNRRNQLGAALHPGQIKIGVAGQRNDLQNLDQNYAVSGAQHPGNLANARGVSDASVANYEAAKDAGIFKTQADAATQAALNAARAAGEQARLERQFIDADAARGVEQRRGGLLTQQEIDRAMRVSSVDMGAVSNIVEQGTPEEITAYLRDLSILPPTMNVVLASTPEGVQYYAVADAAGNVMYPIDEYLNGQRDAAQRILLERTAQEDAAAARAARSKNGGPAAAVDPITRLPEESVPEVGQPSAIPHATEAATEAAAQSAPIIHPEGIAPQRFRQPSKFSPPPAPDTHTTPADAMGAFGVPRPQAPGQVQQYMAAIEREYSARKEAIESNDTFSPSQKAIAIDRNKKVLDSELANAHNIEEDIRRADFRNFLGSDAAFAPENIATAGDDAMPVVIDELFGVVRDRYGLQVNERGLMEFLVNSGRGDIANRIADYLDRDTWVPSIFGVSRPKEMGSEYSIYSGTPEYKELMRSIPMTGLGGGVPITPSGSLRRR